MKIKALSLLLLSALVTYSAAAHAQSSLIPGATEESLPPSHRINYSYEPLYCDFMAGFPEEPMTSHRCEDENDPSSCFDLVSFTKVFELSSTVRVEVICNPATPEIYAHFTPEVMEDTVRAMTKGSVLETFKVSNTEREGYRLAGLIGKGRKGLDDTIYLAQLWISENSIMSVEGELSGQQSPETDQLFAGILSNIGHIRDVEGADYFEKRLKEREEAQAQSPTLDAE